MELFTVAVLTYQQRHHLERCLEHIFLQDYPAIELIVCDDNSCDFDVEEVEAYIRRRKSKNIVSVTVYKQPYYSGETKNCQTACRIAHGTYLKYLKVDEEFADSLALAKAAACFERTGGNAIVSFQRYITEDGRQTGEISPSDVDFRRLQTDSPKRLFIDFGTHPWEPFLCYLPAYFKRQYLEKLGFDPAYTSIPFWVLWLKICESGAKPVLLEEVTVQKRMYQVEDDLGYLSFGMKERYYRDCIRLLEDYAYPRLRAYTLMDRLRCIHAVEIIKIKIDSRKWYTWKFWKRFRWKIHKMPTLFFAWLYRLRAGNSTFEIHKEKRAFCLFTAFFYLDISLFPDRTSNVLWAGGALAALALLLFKEVLKLCTSISRAVLNKRNTAV